MATGSGNTAVNVKLLLSPRQSRGITHFIYPHVFGKEFLTRTIRTNARLRALVPRVYGLGDLSVILDERRAAQTEALLGHMLPRSRSTFRLSPMCRQSKRSQSIISYCCLETLLQESRPSLLSSPQPLQSIKIVHAKARWTECTI